MRLSAKLALSNLRRNKRTTIPFMLTSALCTLMLYLVISLENSAVVSESFGGAQMQMMLGFGELVIVLFTVIFLFYTNSFLMKQRKREFGLFNILGLAKKDIAMVLFVELLICWGVSLVAGIGMGMILDKGMYLLIGRLMNIDLPLEFGISMPAVIQTVLYTGAVYVLLVVYGFFMVNVSSPIELLHAQAEGEKEPKNRWLLALGGLLCLGAGYGLALWVQNPMDAFVLFFLAVILVIVGTYLLFSAGSIALLNMLQKNRHFYYQTSHFISVSGMKYRMKANAASLANICILSTMVLVALSTTICLVMGMDQSVETAYPRETTLSIYSQDGNYLQDFDQALAQSGVQATDVMAYTLFDIPGTVSGDTVSNLGEYGKPDMRLFEFIPVGQYNNAEGTDYTLEPGQVLINPGSDSWGNSLTIGDRTWSVAGTVDGFPPSGLGINMMGNPMLVVLPDEADIAWLQTLVPEEQRNVTNIFAFNSPDPNRDAGVLKDAFEQVTGARPFGDTRQNFALSLQSMYGSFLFVGIFVSILFVMASVLIMYYKQISEGFEDQKRFDIMTRVGLDNRQIRKTIHFQVLAVFFLPLAMAGIHVAFAFPMISKMLALLGMGDITLFMITCLIVFAIFAILYVIVYGLTSRTYYQLVKGMSEETEE
ncbi:ABC transporter permease [Faecalibaculum rodentium]|jgi:putative ABC transport system permease protein|uniref:ABC transporter permease n=1 Tax=Faecalibaculum rodentium TaxID=1702221 RepID=UPI001C3DF900|nr:ABC transporter permease [Faecalibaculum rodentium]